jgi:hypothetical protein
VICNAEKIEEQEIVGKILEKKVRHNYGYNLKLGTCLQLPIMHITKYHLLLKRYIKLLSRSQDTICNLMMQALNLMKSVNDEINNNLISLELSSKMMIDQNESFSQKLALSYGEILKEGELFLAETKKTHYAILYERLFLVKKSSYSEKITRAIPVSIKFHKASLRKTFFY